MQCSYLRLPLSSRSCVIIVVLVGTNTSALLVVCIIKLFNAGRPSSLCVGTYYFFYIALSACT